MEIELARLGRHTARATLTSRTEPSSCVTRALCRGAGHLGATVSENVGTGHSSHSLNPRSKIRVLLVYDSELLSGALVASMATDRQIALVGIERDGRSAVTRLSQIHPDIVLCGVWYPEDVVHTIADVVAARPDVPVLGFGPARSERIPLACLETGAAGYISDDTHINGFLQAIKRAYSGEVLFTRAALADMLRHGRRRARNPAPSGQACVLAPREIEVLQAVTLCLSTEEVAERLGITVSTVRTHLKHILDKLGARSKIEAVIIGLRAGFITLPPSDAGGRVRSLPQMDERSRTMRAEDREAYGAR
jgi:two-component system, NarL family, nitrate/nitrite response regulator NarL